MRRKILNCEEESPIYREIRAKVNKGYKIVLDENKKWVLRK